MAHRIQVVFDAHDTRELAGFWAKALGYIEQPPPAGYESWEAWAEDAGIPRDDWDAAYALIDPDGAGPRLFFQKVPEGKAAKNRVHLDVNVGGGHDATLDERKARIGAHVAMLIDAGGAEVETFERTNDWGTEYWVVMQDNEGNEFCVQ